MDPNIHLAMAKRLMKLRKSQHMLQQWHVAEANRIAEDAQTLNEVLNTAITDEHMTAGTYAEVLRRQTRTMHVHLVRARQVKLRKDADLQDLSQKLELSNRLMQRYTVLAEVEAERSHLEELIDQIAQRPDTSLGPV